MSDTKLVSVRNLSVSYDGKEILHDVNLDIRLHDFIGVVGPNGGGKTTLVKAILKSIPYRGTVEYHPLLEEGGYRRIGYLPQINSIDRAFPISVREVVLSGLQARKGLWGRYSADDREKAQHLLEITNISHLSDRPIGELSGGEFQRVVLCRAFFWDPKLLIRHQPNNFGHNKFDNELYHWLKKFNDRMAILIVSHDLGTITCYIKSVVCVNGTVHYHDSNLITPEELLAYDCPIQLMYHGDIPHTVLEKHDRL